ncbi:MAG: 16S rRNA (uracil(1498)-N(3))-methyltransferase [Sinobacteraceae bacterium]|nr:16S rRNA (uracil(1498)-N(3))-methyltransferase [Nevskiaceae bacterium]MBV9315991.1 16S rRNA (uracil(1498)-N(3))-methyltransferase [Gammaproteobacteria bacterium]
MRLTRVYVDTALEPGADLTLPQGAASHLLRVLRLRPGAALTLFNGRGGEYLARIERVQRTEVTVAVGEHQAIERESPLPLTLAQGVSRGERMDLVVQKATELGVSRLVPVLTERSIVRLDDEQSDRKSSHWRSIAIAACEQCGRNRLPTVALPARLREFLAEPAGDTMRLLLSPSAERRLEDVPRPAAGAAVLIGPEGGLSDSEHADAQAAGFIGVNLGPRVLRTETAAIAALTLLQRAFGDL